jgi:hypothetical protein
MRNTNNGGEMPAHAKSRCTHRKMYLMYSDFRLKQRLVLSGILCHLFKAIFQGRQKQCDLTY